MQTCAVSLWGSNLHLVHSSARMSCFCQSCKCRPGKCVTSHQLCWQQHLLHQHMLLFKHMNRKCSLPIYGHEQEVFSTSHLREGWSRASFLSSKRSRFFWPIFNVIILLWLLWLFLLLLLSLLWSTLFFSCSGTDSCLSLCGTKFIFFRACKEKYYVWESWLLQRFQQEIWNLLVWTQLFHFFLSLFVIPLFFSLFNRKKILFVAVRERLVFILSSFMVPICTFLKVLILVYMQNIPVLRQKKHVTKIRIKKITASHLYFLNIVPLLYYVLQSPKRKKKTLWNKCSFYKTIWNMSGNSVADLLNTMYRQAFYSLLPFKPWSF